MKLKSSPKGLTLFIILTVIATSLFVALPNQFFTLLNLQSMASQIPEFGLLAIGMMLSMITGGIDLSIVAIANFSGVIAALVLTSPYILNSVSVTAAILIAVVLVLLVSALCGLFNGFLITRAGVPAILATLGSQGLFLGLAIIVTKGHSISGLPDEFMFVGNGNVLEIPFSFILFVLIALAISFMLNRTQQGFKMYMVGTNPVVAGFSGINNRRVLMKTYMMTGMLAGLASIIMISRTNSMRAGYGEAYLLQAILVVVLGGTNPNGGFGKISGLIMGIIILQITQSGLNILSLSPFFKKFMWGLALLFVMVVNYFVAQYNTKKEIRKTAVKSADEDAV